MSLKILTRDVPPRSAWALEQAGIHPIFQSTGKEHKLFFISMNILILMISTQNKRNTFRDMSPILKNPFCNPILMIR